MTQKALYNLNYIYDADGERIVRYVPGRLDAFYSANNAGFSDRLESFIYPSGLLTVKTLPEENQRKKQIATYTKHYYIGAERISSVLGSVNSIGYRVCSSDFPTQTEITEMTQKVNQAGQVLQEDYTYFEKQLNLSSTFEKHPGCGGGQTEPETPYWFHPDHLGSSSFISNKDGAISQHLEYFPFGETLVEEHKNSNNSPYKFNAKELDNETGNYYYGARYLNPKFSIWLSVDPLAEERFGMSPYNYVQNNPLIRIDPTGMLDTNYEDEFGNSLANTNDGNNATVIISSENSQAFKDDFDKTSIVLKDMQQKNAEWINKYGEGIVANSKDQVQPWALEAMGSNNKSNVFQNSSTVAGLVLSGYSAYNVNNGKFKGASGNYYTYKNRKGWNQYTGTKTRMNNILFKGKWANRGAKSLGVLGYLPLIHNREEMGNAAFGIEMMSNTISTFTVPEVSIPWTIGYEGLGRNGVARIPWYQNTFKPWARKKLGIND